MYSESNLILNCFQDRSIENSETVDLWGRGRVPYVYVYIYIYMHICISVVSHRDCALHSGALDVEPVLVGHRQGGVSINRSDNSKAHRSLNSRIASALQRKVDLSVCIEASQRPMEFHKSLKGATQLPCI